MADTQEQVEADAKFQALLKAIDDGAYESMKEELQLAAMEYSAATIKACNADLIKSKATIDAANANCERSIEQCSLLAESLRTLIERHKQLKDSMAAVVAEHDYAREQIQQAIETFTTSNATAKRLNDLILGVGQ